VTADYPPGEDTFAARGVVASCSPLASEAGLRMLHAGGNAVDAAVAAAGVLTVVETLTGTLGGDAFVQLWHAQEGRVFALNANGPAPRSATAERYRKLGGIPGDGMPASVVPGTVDGWATMLARWGTKTLAECLAPAHDLAENGFAVGDRWHRSVESSMPKLAKHPTSAAIFLRDGHALPAGTVLRQPDYARSLRRVMDGGRDAFYEGALAHDVSRFSDGHFDPEDFRRHRSEEPPPITTTYRGLTISEQPLPSQGLILLMALNILERFDLPGHGPGSAMAVHIGIEAIKLAFEDRLRYAGDPRFVDVPLDMLLSKEHAADRAKLIKLDAAQPTVVPRWDAPDTTSLVAADQSGNMVSYIHSLFSSNGCIAGSTGIMFNDRMRGFDLDPGSPNVLLPGKRPMHTLNTYVVLRDGQSWFLGGTPGAHFQVQTNLQVITNVVDFGMTLQQAVDYPRWTIGEQGVTPGNSAVNVESRVAPNVLRELEGKGHTIIPESPWAAKGTVQAIMRQGGIYRAATDPRRTGNTISAW
jgi:gamma-glutamyltranspeptidase / glutathione hydrolase